MALKKVPNGGSIGWRLWRAIRRWKWPLAATFFTILMTYVIYWTGPLEYQTSTFGILPIVLSYSVLGIGFFAILAGILYELNTKFRIFYICDNCNKNFVFEGHKNPNIKCPFCSSENLRMAEIIPLKEHPRGIVWNPPEDILKPSSKEKEFKICPLCGSLENIASSVCTKCSYNFDTGLTSDQKKGII
jgi:DNA-directed RNA polymerase subunit RPC12/RpoP